MDTKIKKSDFIESVDSNSNDGTTFKFYNFVNLKKFGETELGIQHPGENHEVYKERLKQGDKIKITSSGWGE